MPVVIEDFQAEITPEAEPATRGAAAGVEGAAEGTAQASQPTLHAWTVLRELVAEREARLAID